MVKKQVSLEETQNIILRLHYRKRHRALYQSTVQKYARKNYNPLDPSIWLNKIKMHLVTAIVEWSNIRHTVLPCVQKLRL